MKRSTVLVLALLLAPHLSHAGALGQLEGIAGRSHDSVNVPLPKMPTAPRSTKGGGVLPPIPSGGGAGSAMGALNMGMQLLSILDAMDASSAAEAQQAQQLAEQRRFEQERLDALRRDSAERLRSSWDQSDAARAATLDGVLDVPRQGTAFFGIAGNPPVALTPQASAAPPTTIPPAALAAAPTTTITPSAQPSTTTDTMLPPSQPAFSVAQNEILQRGWSVYAKTVAKELLSSAVSAGIDLLPASWQAQLAYEHQEKMRTFIDDVFTHLEPGRLVNTIVNGSPAEMMTLQSQIDTGVQKSALRLGVPNDLLEDDELDYLVRLHRGDKVTMNDALRLAKGRLSGMATEKVTERLIFATH